MECGINIDVKLKLVPIIRGYVLHTHIKNVGLVNYVYIISYFRLFVGFFGGGLGNLSFVGWYVHVVLQQCSQNMMIIYGN